MARTVPAEFLAITGPLPGQKVITTEMVAEGQNQNYVAANMCGLLVQQGLCEQSTRWYIRDTSATATARCYWRIPKRASTYAGATITAWIWARVDSGSATLTLCADATTGTVAVTATTWTPYSVTLTLPATTDDWYTLILKAQKGTAPWVEMNSISIEANHGSGTVPTTDGGFVYLDDARSGADPALSVHREALKKANCAALLIERLGMLLAYSDDYQTEAIPGSGRLHEFLIAHDQPTHIIRDMPCRIGPGANNIRVDFIGLSSAGTATLRLWTDNNYDAAMTAAITNTSPTISFTSVDLFVRPDSQARTVKLWAQLEPSGVNEAALITNICAWEEINP